MCSVEVVELRSVEKLLWANHAKEKARISPKRKILNWNNFPEKNEVNSFIFIFEN